MTGFDGTTDGRPQAPGRRQRPAVCGHRRPPGSGPTGPVTMLNRRDNARGRSPGKTVPTGAVDDGQKRRRDCVPTRLSVLGYNPPKAPPDILCASSRKQLNNCERLPPARPEHFRRGSPRRRCGGIAGRYR